MPTKQLHIPSIGPVELRKRRRSRSIRITLASDGGVRISMPSWVAYARAIEFALTKRRWIEEHRRQAVVLRHGHHIGKAHRLQFVAAEGRGISTRLIGNEVRIYHPLTLTSTAPQVQKAAQSASSRALKKESLSLLPQRLKDLASQHTFIYQSVRVKRLTSRWGSCSQHADITLNIFLVQLPWHLIDYVLLHELVHTRIHNHGPRFWQEFEKHLPDAKQLRKAIREYQPILQPQ